MSDIKLYTYWRSSASWRVRIALHHKGIDFESIFVNLLKGEQASSRCHPDEFKATNPTGLVPALVINGETILESPAILELLEELFPERPLLPKDPIARAKVRAIANIIGCDIHPVQNLRVLKYAGQDRMAEWAKHFIDLGFEGLEKVVKGTAGKYCFGDEVTLADVFLVPQIGNAVRWGVDMSKFPTLAAIGDRLGELDAFRKAHPTAQPDAAN
ncbi:hypothetical protein HK105_208701 [Polyrhizophydium stewartii]|uniref:Maleylacetoacetate isomerase n=1 Tax=Polyrhizophydium stewartii TaxID=2732419 RepID=A0ABR4MXB5_9FUNG|nr:hypothetical protein HK105_001827 [Polyrhizophydium stewartii]